jgi:hypothetical protein
MDLSADPIICLPPCLWFRAVLAHDPDPKGRVSAKCVAVFRKDHAQTKGYGAMMIHLQIIAP